MYKQIIVAGLAALLLSTGALAEKPESKGKKVDREAAHEMQEKGKHYADKSKEYREDAEETVKLKRHHDKDKQHREYEDEDGDREYHDRDKKHRDHEKDEHDGNRNHHDRDDYDDARKGPMNDKTEQERKEIGKGSEQGQATREEHSRKWWKFWEN